MLAERTQAFGTAGMQTGSSGREGGQEAAEVELRASFEIVQPFANVPSDRVQPV